MSEEPLRGPNKAPQLDEGYVCQEKSVFYVIFRQSRCLCCPGRNHMFLTSLMLGFIFKCFTPSIYMCLYVLQMLIPCHFLPHPHLQVHSQIFNQLSRSLLQRPGRVNFRCRGRPLTKPGISPLGPFLADYWDHSFDAKSRAIEPSSKQHAGPSSTANHSPAPDKCPGPDHRHRHWEPDLASDQHPGHHTLTHQAQSTGKASCQAAMATWTPLLTTLQFTHNQWKVIFKL